MNTLLRTLAVISLVVLPYTAHALTQEELMAQVQTLLGQVAALQQQLGSTVQSDSYSPYAQTTSPYAADTSSASCPRAGRVLKMGSSGDDVTRLQKFLARDYEVYPEAVVSGYFGSLTEAAVQRWQAKHRIVSSGTPDTTGYGVVGPRTSALIASQCAGGSDETPATQVGGFIKVSPVTGSAPLQVSAEVTINTTHSCGAITYTLDWGDGSPVQNIPLSAGICQEAKQTFAHTYVSGGTYTVLLSALGHSTSATVVVSGPQTSTGTTVSNGTGATPDTFSANTTTGSAPLTVNFSGSINGGGACGGGYYTLLFGDTQTQTIAYPAVCSAQTYNVTHRYDAPGTYSAVLYRGAVGMNPVGTIQIRPSPAGVSGTYQVPVLATNPSLGARAIKLTLDLPSPCTAYDVDWGDGTIHAMEAQGTCSAATTQRTYEHVYATGGTRTVTVKRGASLERMDSFSVSISQ